MKFKGIIPEVKMSESKFDIYAIIEMLEPYPIVSVNTSSLFKGDIALLRLIRATYPKKFLIRKDFIMIPKQIVESKEAGADAVLIIKEFLNQSQYDELIKSCKENKIIPITEVHKSSQIFEGVVLYNSRNLNTGKLHKREIKEHCRIMKSHQENVIYASGENSDRVIKEGIADAVLIGTAFVKDKLR